MTQISFPTTKNGSQVVNGWRFCHLLSSVLFCYLHCKMKLKAKEKLTLKITMKTSFSPDESSHLYLRTSALQIRCVRLFSGPCVTLTVVLLRCVAVFALDLWPMSPLKLCCNPDMCLCVSWFHQPLLWKDVWSDLDGSKGGARSDSRCCDF